MQLYQKELTALFKVEKDHYHRDDVWKGRSQYFEVEINDADEKHQT